MVKDISSFIENQFPSVYRAEGKTFVAFVKAYYEWLEQQEKVDLLDAFDIDRTIDGFVAHFKKTYLNSFPFVKASSVDFLVKHIYDFFRSKGTEESVRLLIMMMFGEEATIYTPSDHILKPSASVWREPRYLEVDSKTGNYDLVGKQVYGVKSNAKAIVESVVTKVSRGKFIDIIYVSSLQGSFLTGEKVTADGNISTSPTVIGSLTTISVTNGGRDFKVGDVLNVGSDYGIGGQVRVKSVMNSTGRVDFELIDGGSGYTTTPTTDIYISDGVIFFNNEGEGYIDLETVKQQIEQVAVLSAADIEDQLTIGADIRGVDAAGVEITRGVLTSATGTSSDPVLDIAVSNGTFLNQRRLQFDGVMEGATIDFDVTCSGTMYLRLDDIDDLDNPHQINLATIAAGTTHVTCVIPEYTVQAKMGFLCVLNNVNAQITNWRITGGRNIPLNTTGYVTKGMNSVTLTANSLSFVVNTTGGQRPTHTIPLPTPMTSKVGDLLETPSRQELSLADVTGMAVGNRIEQTESVSFPAKSGELRISGAWQANETFKCEDGGGLLRYTGTILRRTGNLCAVSDLKYYNGATTVSVADVIETTTVGNSTTGTVIENLLGANTTTTSRIYGTIESIAGNVVTVYPAFGTFREGIAVNSYSGGTPTGTSGVSLVGTVTQPSRAAISAINGAQFDVRVIMGMMPSAGGTVWNLRSGQTTNVVDNTNIGATDIWVGGISTANAVIDTVTDVSVTGMIVGQNTSSIGVWGNTAPFLTAEEMIDQNTISSVSQITVVSNNVIRATVSGTNHFVLNDYIKSNINIQSMNEIKTVEGVYRVTASSGQNVRLSVPNPDFDTFRNPFSMFPSTITRTTLVGLKTDRSEMISPPRNANGNIIEITSYGIKSSKGNSASFKIGSIENDEVVFVETDFLKDRNVANVLYRDIGLDGRGSSVGFLDNITFTNGGTGYANGQTFTFTGGGMNGAEPLGPAQATISTDGSGTITNINILDHGEGYWEFPEMTVPSTAGTPATGFTLRMDFGYGFPKLPNGDHTNLLIDLLDRQPMTIGTISSLNAINPGQQYDANPFVKVHNRYIAGFERKNFLLNMTNKVGSYVPGEMVYQNVGGTIFPKGIVIEDFGATTFIKRTFFNTSFSEGVPLIGVISASSGVISSFEEIIDSPVMGDNAIISSEVISANGIINEIDVIDSGWGYLDSSSVTLSNEDSRYIVEGLISNRTQGKGLGYWETETSHLNSETKLQDSDYYQEFSYEVVSPVSFNRYRSLLQNIMHVAGSKMFGRFSKGTQQDTGYTTLSEIQVESPLNTISPFYGTGDGEIFLHLMAENRFVSGAELFVENMGGSGDIYDARISAEVQTENNVFEFPGANNNGFLELNQAIPVQGTRFFIIGNRSSTAVWHQLTFSDVNPTEYLMLRSNGNMTHGGSTIAASSWIVGSTTASMSEQMPRDTALALFEVEVEETTGRMLTAYNLEFDEAQAGVYATPFEAKRLFNGDVQTNAWFGTVFDVIAVRPGSADIEELRQAIYDYYLARTQG